MNRVATRFRESPGSVADRAGKHASCNRTALFRHHLHGKCLKKPMQESKGKNAMFMQCRGDKEVQCAMSTSGNIASSTKPF